LYGDKNGNLESHCLFTTCIIKAHNEGSNVMQDLLLLSNKTLGNDSQVMEYQFVRPKDKLVERIHCYGTLQETFERIRSIRATMLSDRICDALLKNSETYEMPESKLAELEAQVLTLINADHQDMDDWSVITDVLKSLLRGQ